MKRNQSYIIFCLFLVSCNQTPKISQIEKDFDLESSKEVLSREIDKILQETGIPSISISLILNDTIIWSEAFGYMNVKKKIPANTSTIYCTGSTFKLMTATAIMTLAEKGKLSIDDPINNYLGDLARLDFKKENTPITFRHLLCHHSGLRSSYDDVPLWSRENPKDLENLLLEARVAEPPGNNFHYENINYAILGLLIEKISGQSFQDYLIENILMPLNIQSKGPNFPAPFMIEELALPYNIINNTSEPEMFSRVGSFPAGYAYFSCYDYAKFLSIHLNNGYYQGKSILNKKLISDMHESQFGTNYGFGTHILKKGENKILSHGGTVFGFSSIFLLNTETKSGVFLMSNAGFVYNELVAIADLSLKLLKGDKQIQPLPSFARDIYQQISVPSNILKKYTGEYKMEPDILLSITLEDSHVFAQVKDQPKYEFFAYEKNKFFAERLNAQIQFNFEGDQVKSLILSLNGEFEAMKID